MAQCVQWKPVPIAGFEHDYEVNTLGEVRSRKTGHYRKLKPKLNKHTGYKYVNLYNKDESVTRSLHRLVAMAFIPNPENKPEVNHINEEKTDNSVSNLEWVTSHENNEHSKYKRLKPVDVYSVDGEHLATFTSARAMSEMLGISRPNICNALKTDGRTCEGFIVKYAKEVQ